MFKIILSICRLFKTRDAARVRKWIRKTTTWMDCGYHFESIGYNLSLREFIFILLELFIIDFIVSDILYTSYFNPMTAI